MSKNILTGRLYRELTAGRKMKPYYYGGKFWTQWDEDRTNKEVKELMAIFEEPHKQGETK